MPLCQSHKEKPYRGGAEKRDTKKRRKKEREKGGGFLTISLL
jgi:hypothetical protein